MNLLRTALPRLGILLNMRVWTRLKNYIDTMETIFREISLKLKLQQNFQIWKIDLLFLVVRDIYGTKKLGLNFMQNSEACNII